MRRARSWLVRGPLPVGDLCDIIGGYRGNFDGVCRKTVDAYARCLTVLPDGRLVSEVVFRDDAGEADSQTIFTPKNVMIGGTALAAAGFGVGALVHREKLQRLFKSGNSNGVATTPNKRTQHGSKSLRTLLEDYERLNIRQACAEGRVDPTNVSVWANRSGLWVPVDISGLWGRKLSQSLCSWLVMGMFGFSRAQYEAMLNDGNSTAAIEVYRHKMRDHYAILMRLPAKFQNN